MNIKDALKTALAHMGTVNVHGKNDMKNQVAAMEYVEAVLNALESTEKEEKTDEA